MKHVNPTDMNMKDINPHYLFRPHDYLQDPYVRSEPERWEYKG